jgi:hypothetical protein
MKALKSSGYFPHPSPLPQGEDIIRDSVEAIMPNVSLVAFITGDTNNMPSTR